MLVPLHAIAQDGTAEATVPVYSSPVIITEVQTGASSAGDEFVELYNVGLSAVDISGWQVRYANSTANHQTTLLAALGEAGSPLMLPAQSYFVLHTTSVAIPPEGMGQIYSAKLSSADKVVALYKPDPALCSLGVQDAVAWGASSDGEGTSALVTGLGNGDRLLRRYRDAAGRYIDTDRNDSDATVSAVVKDSVIPAVSVGASPGTDNLVLAAAGTGQVGPGSGLASISIDGCVIPAPDEAGGTNVDPVDGSPPSTVDPPAPDPAEEPVPEEAAPSLPASDVGLALPQLSELLPNPASPLSDAEDEFIELYNPNDVPYDLAGFSLMAGTHQYTFAGGSELQPKSFQAFFSSQTHVGLTNTAGQVRLLDPYGNVVSQSDVYDAAKDNQAWVFAASIWQWTTTPTPNAANVVTAPAVKAKVAAKTTTAAPKKTTVKAATIPKASKPKTAATTAQSMPANVVVRSPLHPGVLALVGGFALLYGAYEYRSDMANRIYQFRVHRAARREARRGTPGRRGD